MAPIMIADDLDPKPGEELRTANARLRALIDIGFELSSELDPDRLFQRVGVAARDLFGASYVTLGIVDPNDRNDAARPHLWSGPVERDARQLDREPVRRSRASSGPVVAERRTMRGANPGGDPARLQLPVRHPEIQTYLAAPIASPVDGLRLDVSRRE